jgi:hypothetical protein
MMLAIAGYSLRDKRSPSLAQPYWNMLTSRCMEGVNIPDLCVAGNAVTGYEMAVWSLIYL